MPAEKKLKRIYMDHAATTCMDSRVEKAMRPFWRGKFGNPSSLYQEGFETREELDKAKSKIARVLNCRSSEIVFTNGGTESDNLAIFGAARARKQEGKHIITTQIEHHAVLNPCEYLEKKEGFKITYLTPGKDGIVKVKDLEKAVKKDTILISVMFANNEIGTIQPIAEIGKLLKRINEKRKNKIYFHTDACQAAGYLDMNVQRLGVDLLTLNGSKIYGPKGTGILFMRRGIKIEPQILGGGQENGFRSGTENIGPWIGLAEALSLAQKEKEKEGARIAKLRDALAEGILKHIPKTFVNGSIEKRLPNNINISILDIEGEAMVLYLDEAGISASTGSACASRSLEPSYVLRALGLSREEAHGSLRLTLGKRNTKKDVDYILRKLPKIVKRLREMSPISR